jgi:hypothetical protein
MKFDIDAAIGFTVNPFNGGTRYGKPLTAKQVAIAILDRLKEKGWLNRGMIFG